VELRHHLDHRGRRGWLTTGEARPWEKEVVAKDGRKVPLLASAVLIPGKPLQCIAFALDLSEHKRIDRELHESVRISTATADFALALTMAPSLESILQRSCDAIHGLFELERVELWTVEDDELRLRASAGAARAHAPEPLKLAEEGLAQTSWPERWEPFLAARDGFERVPVTMAGELVGLIRLVSQRPLEKLAREAIVTLSGRQLSERIRNTRPSLPVLFMSGYMDDTVLREGVSREAVYFLQKPIHPEALASKVLDASAARAFTTQPA
jgi:CheY-like chemotaxis protein